MSSVLLAGLSASLSGQTYNISTVAGRADIGDGATASAGVMIQPDDVAVDASGNIYIADFVMNIVRRIDGKTGIISTAAGTGGVAFNDGAAATSRLSAPTGLATDAAGNLYIADNGYQHICQTTPAILGCTGNANILFSGTRVRKVDTSGNVTTFAGTGGAGYTGDGRKAIQARFRDIQGLSADNAGNRLLICDSRNNRIRAVDFTSGIVNTVAGNGPTNSTTGGFAGDGGSALVARLGAPQGVTVDASGNIVIADTTNNRIRLVDAKTGIIDTIVGSAPPVSSTNITGTFLDGKDGLSATLSRPRDVKVDPAGNILIADAGNNRIRSYNPTTKIVSTLAGCGNFTVTVRSANNTISTVQVESANTCNDRDGRQAKETQFNEPRGIDIDGAGNLYIADSGSGRVRVVSAADGITTTLIGVPLYGGDGASASSAKLSNPRGLAIDLAGNTVIADTNNQRVRTVSAAGAGITLLAGSNPAGGFAGESVNGPGVALTARLNNPGCVAVDVSNSIYVADRSNHRVRKIDPYGNITTVAGTGTAGYTNDGQSALNARLNNPECVAVDKNGNIYIADSANHAVRKVTPSGTITTLAGNGGQGGVALAGASGDGQTSTNSLLNTPRGVAVNRSGTLLAISDTNNGVVRQVDLVTGVISQFAGVYGDLSVDAAVTVSWLSRLAFQTGVAYDSKDNIYIADTWNNRVMKADQTGNMVAIGGNNTGLFGNDGKAALATQIFLPVGIAVDATDNVYVTDRVGIVRKLTPQ